jgi:hypothetical protein
MKDLLDTPISESVPLIYRKDALICWLSILLSGIILVLLDVPFSNELVLAASGGLTAFSWYWFTWLRNRSIINNIVCILAIGWFLAMLWGATFNGGYPYNFYAMILYGLSFAITFGIQLIVFYTKPNSK